MTAKFFADKTTGAYIGAFDGWADESGTVHFPILPINGVEVPVPPTHAMQKWNGAAWADTPELVKARAADNLANSDAGMIRVLEDLISALVGKGAITLADLPQAARDKLAARAAERAKL